MHEYVLLFRMDLTTPGAQPTQDELDEYMVGWTAWIDGIAAQGRLAGGSHFSPEGRLVRGSDVQNALYSSSAESVSGYILVLAHSFDDAVGIARRCPILDGRGTSVEVRQTAAPGAA